jgi:hypothetical protein
MPQEPRNLYHVLHVQPEAPAEIIKASYRALMSSLRAHPDLGGDTEKAAQINAAYAVLGDPERRRDYDLSLSRPDGRASAAATAGDTVTDLAADWLETRRCPFCGTGFTAAPETTARCGRCEAPLHPAPAPRRVPSELLGRRHGERVAREIDARVHLPGQAQVLVAVLRDVSITGLAMACVPALARGTVMRVTTATFDAVAQVVACRATRQAHMVHARLLTLQVLRAPQEAPEPVVRTA